MKRGIKKLKEIGTVVEYDGKDNIDKWNDTYCDTFNGTDGTIFHPFFGPTEDIVSFSPDICRSMPATFERKSKAQGMYGEMNILILSIKKTLFHY